MSIQGSTTSILDKTGKGELSYEYEEFGETTIHGGSGLANEICYTGGIYDESTGLYYLNARYYDPTTGRFLTEDTYRGESGDVADWHLYAYCENDPINYADPSGHMAVLALRIGSQGGIKILAKIAGKSLMRYLLSIAASITPTGWLLIGVVVVGGIVYAKTKRKTRVVPKGDTQKHLVRVRKINIKKEKKDAKWIKEEIRQEINRISSLGAIKENKEVIHHEGRTKTNKHICNNILISI